MLKRLIENWLIKASERTYELPFCHLLTAEQHQVIHLSRHGFLEQGKDILSIAPDGTPCAYQLKAGNITYSVYNSESDQLRRLVELPIKHSSIPSDIKPRVYLVTNGNLDEEVKTELQDRNLAWEQRGYPRIETIVLGQLVDRFANASTDFFPIKLDSTKSLLEFFLNNGKGNLDKSKFFQFLYSFTSVEDIEPKKLDSQRLIAGLAILASFSLSPYQETDNHVALFEGWVICSAVIAAFIERIDLPERMWKQTINLTYEMAISSLKSLQEELQEREFLWEGDPKTDFLFYRARLTWLSGLVATLQLSNYLTDARYQFDEFSISFIRTHLSELELWGEGAIPSFLAIMWFLQKSEPDQTSDVLLEKLIKAICDYNQEKNSGLFDPYKSIEEAMEEKFNNEVLGIKPSYSYLGRSYALESVVQLFVRRNWRSRFRFLWPEISYIDFVEFIPEYRWQFLRWLNEEEGHLKLRKPNVRQSWTQLRAESSEVNLDQLPHIFRSNPSFLLLFLMTFPHRVGPNVVKFLDDVLSPKK